MPLRINKIDLNRDEDKILIEVLEKKFVRPGMDLDGAQTILELYGYRVYQLSNGVAVEVDQLEENQTYYLGSEVSSIGDEGNQVEHKLIARGFEFTTDENGNIDEIKSFDDEITFPLEEI